MLRHCSKNSFEALGMAPKFDAAHSILLRTGMPTGWNDATVAELARIEGGGTPDRDQAAYWRNGTVPWITPSDLTANGTKFISSGAENISLLGLENSNATLVPPGSIVFSTRGTVGSLAIASVPLTCNQSCEILIPDTLRVCGDFLYYLLTYGYSAFIRLSEGTTFGSITRREIARVRFAVPDDIGEQASIARVLEAVDAALERTRMALVAAKMLAASLVEEAVNGVLLNPKEDETWTHPRLGSIPKTWLVERVGKACSRIVDGTHQAVQTSRAGVPFLYVSCVKEGRILWENAGKITERTYSFISKGREPQAGCVLYTAVGSYGNAALVTTSEPFSFQRHIAILYPRPQRLLGGYLAMWLNSSKGKRWSEIHAVGNAQKTVTLTELGKLLIPLPPIEVQHKLCEVVSGAEAKVDTVARRLSAFGDLKRALMHDLLTGRVRVKSPVEAIAS
jgi:type I restriction enzyme, S subunit